MAVKTKGKKKAKKGRRTRSPHPGVVLVESPRPDGRMRWRAKWSDPVTGRDVWKTLDGRELGLTNATARERWAKDKSASLQAERARIASGRAAKTRTTPSDAVKAYVKRRKGKVEESTLTVYQESLDRFPAWAERAGLRHVEDLTPSLLADLHGHLCSRQRLRPVRGGKKGEHRKAKRKLSPATINRDFRTLRVFLHDLRRLRQLPLLDSDDIRDQLGALKVRKPLPQFLRAHEIRALLEAARRHDRATFAMTRDEKGGAGAKLLGSTPRHPSVFPFVSTVLLTGMRLGEALGLRWAEVDLEEECIRLDAGRVKTGHGRRIDLDVSPSLLPMLRAMRLRAGKATRVFDHLTEGTLVAARKRLRAKYGAPAFTWQELRRTCGTWLTCAPSIFGAASAFLSAKRLGHGVLIAEKHYVGQLTGISQDARTLEAAMGIEDLLSSDRANSASAAV
jgi:integrase